jgi:hypothetical protein
MESQFAIDPIDPVSFTIHRTGAEINKMGLMFSSGLDFLCRHELMSPMRGANHNLNDRQIWEDLKSNSVTEGRSFSNPPSMFRGSDASIIRHLNSHNLAFKSRFEKETNMMHYNVVGRLIFRKRQHDHRIARQRDRI